MKIGSLEFPDYLARRLRKDGLGFLPCDWNASKTDRYTYIASPIVKTPEDLLAYCHELGHCKGKQKIDRQDLFSMWGGATSPTTIYNEINAWDWALRYVKRLGVFIPTNLLQDVLDRSLGSYLKNAEHSGEVLSMLNSFNKKFGCNVVKREPTKIKMDGFFNFDSDVYKNFKMEVLKERKEIKGDHYTLWGFDDVWSEPVVYEKKHDKWKPWHDLQEKSARKVDRRKIFKK